MLQSQQPMSVVVDNPEALVQACQGQEPIQILADFNDLWWLQAALHRPPHIATLSAPCPPWSRASSQAGLNVADGLLSLRAPRLMKLLEVPVVVVEQVEGFCLHPHYAEIMTEWKEANYEVLWKATVDLGEVLPASRRRHLMVLRLEKLSDLPGIVHVAWHQAVLPNLEQAGVILDHPQDILRSSILAPELLAKYLNPAYLPPQPLACRRQQSPRRYRLRDRSGRPGCFLAQYGQQHKLPDPLLRAKGILGTLFCEEGTTRFFSAPEIACMQGLVRPLLFVREASVNYKLVGNSISTPHAMLALTHGLRALNRYSQQPPTAVAECLKIRACSSNAVFVPCARGWMLCQQAQVNQVLSGLLRHSLVARLLDLDWQPFVTARLSRPNEEVTVHVSAVAKVPDLEAHLGVKAVRPTAGLLLEPTLWMEGIPVLTCSSPKSFNIAEEKLSTVLTGHAWYVIPGSLP